MVKSNNCGKHAGNESAKSQWRLGSVLELSKSGLNISSKEDIVHLYCKNFPSSFSPLCVLWIYLEYSFDLFSAHLFGWERY
jgi:hypothetical protein